MALKGWVTKRPGERFGGWRRKAQEGQTHEVRRPARRKREKNGP
jgi:hypothetical protein